MADSPELIGSRVMCHAGDLREFADELHHAQSVLPRRINADPENIETGLAKLVLTLIELIRQLMEQQAIRRIEAGSLTHDEIERLGQTFQKLEVRLRELREVFGLKAEDLNLNLGPLGDLL